MDIHLAPSPVGPWDDGDPEFFALLAEGSSLLKARSNDTFRLKSRGAMGKLHRTQRSPRLRTRPHGSSDHGRDIEFWHHRSRSGAAPALSSTAAQHPPLRSIQTPEHLYQLESARGVRAPASPSKQQQIPLSRVGWRPRPSSGTDPALRRPTLARPRAAAPCDSVLGERLDLAGILSASPGVISARTTPCDIGLGREHPEPRTAARISPVSAPLRRPLAAPAGEAIDFVAPPGVRNAAMGTGAAAQSEFAAGAADWETTRPGVHVLGDDKARAAAEDCARATPRPQGGWVRPHSARQATPRPSPPDSSSCITRWTFAAPAGPKEKVADKKARRLISGREPPISARLAAEGSATRGGRGATLPAGVESTGNSFTGFGSAAPHTNSSERVQIRAQHLRSSALLSGPDRRNFASPAPSSRVLISSWRENAPRASLRDHGSSNAPKNDVPEDVICASPPAFVGWPAAHTRTSLRATPRQAQGARERLKEPGPLRLTGEGLCYPDDPHETEETLQEENMQADSPAEFFRALSDAGIRSAVEKKASQATGLPLTGQLSEHSRLMRQILLQQLRVVGDVEVALGQAEKAWENLAEDRAHTTSGSYLCTRGAVAKLSSPYIKGHIVTNLLSGMISRDAPALMRTVAQTERWWDTDRIVMRYRRDVRTCISSASVLGLTEKQARNLIDHAEVSIFARAAVTCHYLLEILGVLLPDAALDPRARIRLWSKTCLFLRMHEELMRFEKKCAAAHGVDPPELPRFLDGSDPSEGPVLRSGPTIKVH